MKTFIIVVALLIIIGCASSAPRYRFVKNTGAADTYPQDAFQCEKDTLRVQQSDPSGFLLQDVVALESVDEARR